MKSRNIAIIAVAAAAVAACLVVSYVADDGWDGTSRAPIVGDYHEYEVTYIFDDGQRYTSVQRVTFVGQLGDMRLVMYGDGFEWYNIMWTDATYYDLSVMGADFVRTETIHNDVYGDMDCRVYVLEGEYSTTTFWRAEGIAADVRQVYEEVSLTIEYDLVGTNADEDSHEYPGYCGKDLDIGAGDFMEYECTLSYGEKVTVRLTVTAVDGDSVTYENSLDGSVGTCSAEGFLGGGLDAQSDGEGLFLIESPYGERLCSRITVVDGMNTQYFYVGLEDGICYLRESIGADRYVWVLQGSTNISALG